MLRLNPCTEKGRLFILDADYGGDTVATSCCPEFSSYFIIYPNLIFFSPINTPCDILSTKSPPASFIHSYHLCLKGNNKEGGEYNWVNRGYLSYKVIEVKIHRSSN